MCICQALGLRHADIRSFDGEIEIVPRSNLNGARTKPCSPYVMHVSKEAMALYAGAVSIWLLKMAFKQL
jgi:integrase/recombinase XerD